MKLPVFTAFGASVSYIAANFLTLLRIAWLPALLMMAVTVLLTPPMLEAQMNMAGMRQAGETDAAALALVGESFKNSAYIFLASAVFYPMLYGGLLRHAVRGEGPRFLPFYFRFGADEFRLLISYIVVVAMFALAGFAGVLGVMVAGVVSALVSKSAGVVVVAVGAGAFVVALVWFSLRMSLLFPATVADRTVGVGRSWQTTKGAAWSLLFYWLLWGAVFMAISAAYAAFAAAALFEMLPQIFAAAGDEAAMAAVELRLLETQAALYDMSKPEFWIYNAATYAYLVLGGVFACAAGGVAYRFLAGEERG